MKILKTALFTLFAVMVTASLGMAAGGGHFTAKLSGKGEVPAVKTKASGEAYFKLSKDEKELTYELKVKHIADVTAAHIHMGKKGEEGGVVAGLFAGPEKKGAFSGVLAKGTITDKDLVGALAGKTVADLLKIIKEKDAYVNVHTTGHPGGEIRGEL